VWIESERVLAIADLHLGYAWAHRHNGQLLPVAQPDDCLKRLQALCASYSPKHLVLLGDIVHQALALEPIERELNELRCCFGPDTQLVLIRGNHDRKLAPLAARAGLELTSEFSAGEYLFVHGDKEPSPAHTGKLVFMGHEHPAISLGDGISNRKFPCFLLSEKVIVLPAFSSWAAGANVRTGRYMSALASKAGFDEALAILGERLLPVRL